MRNACKDELKPFASKLVDPRENKWMGIIVIRPISRRVQPFLCKSCLSMPFSSRAAGKFARLTSFSAITKEVPKFCAVKEEPKMEDGGGENEWVQIDATVKEKIEVSMQDMKEANANMEVDGPLMEPVPKHTMMGPLSKPASDDMLFLDEFESADDIDVENLKFDFADLNVDDFPNNVPNVEGNCNGIVLPIGSDIAIVMSEGSSIAVTFATSNECSSSSFCAISNIQTDVPGFRQVADADLVKVSKGKEQPKSANNDRWALRRVDTLRSAMGWDMTIPFRDLSFDQIDILLTNLFARVVKVKGGGTYPSSSLMNMLGGYNRIIRRANDIRTLNGVNTNMVERSFQIKNHLAFTRTRLTLKAALTKGQKEGANKKPVTKVHVVSKTMEEALFADIEHQITDNRACQKQLALLLMLRIGVRGGDELYDLDRDDIEIGTDRHLKEFVKFEERGSKNNSVTIDRYGPEQFRKVFHNYEPRFIMCVKQYKRHLPALMEGVKRDLFLGCITNHVGNVWFNRASKVGKDTSHKWLKNMLELVGIPGDLISNKSGRATLITRLAASGVPDEVGRFISGHHTQSGYSRYDCTQPLKMEAAQLCTFNPGMKYDDALREVSKQFVAEQLVGGSENLKPLVDRSANAEHLQLALRSELQITEVSNDSKKGKGKSVIEQGGSSNSGQLVTVKEHPTTFAKWHEAYDCINWDEAMRKDPVLARALGGRGGANFNNLGGNTFSNLSNCTIQICVGGPMQDPKMQDPGKNEGNKENMATS